MCIFSNACLSALLNAMSACQSWVGSLESGIIHFLKVTNSYWSGLFHCYSVPGNPRTNNDLEHTFGIVRHHHRRCTGRKAAPTSLVLRGSVQARCLCRYSKNERSMLSSWLLFQSQNGASYVRVYNNIKSIGLSGCDSDVLLLITLLAWNLSYSS